jgi:hypothetical protein
MKQLLFSILFLFGIITNVFSQTWAPIGAKWTYQVENAVNINIGFREWTSVSDTLIDGHDCKIILRSGDPVNSDLSDSLITYEENGVVYWYLNNQFTTLYDFNKLAGESWTVMRDTCGVVITVDSTAFETINGVELKTLYVSSEDFAFSGKIIEFIGNTSMPSPYFLYHCDGILKDTYFYTGLRCYEDTIIGYHSFNISPSCDYVTNISEQHEQNALLVYPNPTSESIQVQTNPALSNHYKIFNNTGQLVQRGSLHTSLSNISVSTLSPGIYFFEVQTDKNITQQRFIIQR